MTKDLRFRFSYQEGFRGVVGVSYAGGFEGDGHLRIQNFPYIESSSIPSSFDNQGFASTFYKDVPKTKPEKMRSFEFATNYNFTSNLSIENILFFNKVEKVIDVGVLYCDRPSTSNLGPNGCVMPRLGNDVQETGMDTGSIKIIPEKSGKVVPKYPLTTKIEKFLPHLVNQ